MKSIQLHTARRVFPMVYAYSTPQIKDHNGWTKIGYTEKQSVSDRIKQQTHTSDVITKIEWQGNAMFDDGTGERFTDKDFHGYLLRSGINNKKGTEWFQISGPDGKRKFDEFRSNRGVLEAPESIPYKLRNEQSQAVKAAADYFKNNEDGEFLWNAKPRFGKTLAVYDLCKKLEAKKVLVVTNRPAIANSWYEDYVKFMGDASGYKFVSDTDSLKGKKYVLSRDDFIGTSANFGCIEFLSLQDLKGSIYFGGKFDKLKAISEIEWDLLIIDEAHEGVDTFKTDAAFENIKRKATLHLSGTPFKALANAKFRDNEIYNWTYADEQKAKRDWSGDEQNPYENLPKLSLYTYQMSEIIQDKVKKGLEIAGETEEYAFDLNEFFATRNGRFIHDESVTKFLDALTRQEKFPFSTEELRDELKHTFWILDRVDSAKAMKRKLETHPIFSNYDIVLAAGDGKLDDSEETKKSYDKVVKAIQENDKTITLSVGQLTTGVTIPEWSAVLMLSNMKSPALYMQAAFRAQNPCLYQKDEKFFRKENAYIFDFDPARTLGIVEEFANDLSSGTSGGKGSLDERKQNIRELLNFLPVIGEDENGEMISLDAEKVLSIPRKIRSQEVVRRGFMSNFLFQNVYGVFGAPPEVIDIINKFEPHKEAEIPKNIGTTATEIGLDPSTGTVSVDPQIVIGQSQDIFGNKIYGDKEILQDFNKKLDEAADKARTKEDEFEHIKNALTQTDVASTLVESAKNKLGLKDQETKKLKKEIQENLKKVANKVATQFEIKTNVARQDRDKALKERFESGKSEKAINEEFNKRQEEINKGFADELRTSFDDFITKSAETIIESHETTVREEKKAEIEEDIRDHLRGFSRTIPSFLMAYGNQKTPVTLENFDAIVPDDVFSEVTGITKDQFRFLRDGGDYVDSEGKAQHFKGELFDPVVFNDSVKEFLSLKKKLANYFEEKSSEDIFDYIPPQKTNQIFTPKATVKLMVNLLENENPGCFDDPNKTFADLYMKSGLFISEIVKRLYQSKKMEELYPDPNERLRHIFEKQVFGLAPTGIIYRIATAYLLGFNDDGASELKNNFRQFDSLPYAEDGTLASKVEELSSEAQTQS